MSKFFLVFLFLFSFVECSEKELILTGKLHKKYYEAPSMVKHRAYAWFLELDGKSQCLIRDQFYALPQEDRDLYETIGIDLKLVQCLGNGDLLSRLKNSDCSDVWIKGLVKPPLFCRKIPCFSIDCQQLESLQERSSLVSEEARNTMDLLSSRDYCETELSKEFDGIEELTEKEVCMQGKLILRLFAGPPEYTSIEEGDEPDYSWLLLIDETREELALCLNDDAREFCNKHAGTQISVNGMLFPAHTAHHPTPCLIHVKNISLLNKQ